MKLFSRSTGIIALFVSSYIFLHAVLGTNEVVAPETKTPAPEQMSIVYESRIDSSAGQVTFYVAEIYNPEWGAIGSVVAPSKMLPSEMAEAIGAEIAINGDFFGYRGTGIIVRGGHILIDEPRRDGMGFRRDGKMIVYRESDTSAQDLIDAGVANTFSFGPILVTNGQINPDIAGYEVDALTGGNSIHGRHPRTGVCQTTTGVTMMIVVDGRNRFHSVGIELIPFAELMKKLGCHVGYNLDGGGSSVMIHDGKIVNQPSDKTGERPVSDMIYLLP